MTGYFPLLSRSSSADSHQVKSGGDTLMRGLSGALALSMGLFLLQNAGAVQPPRFNYQAKLTDAADNPLAGNQTLFFSLFHGGTSASGGTKVFEETKTLNIVDGVANHTVGTGQNQNLGALTASDFNFSGDIYLQVAVSLDTNIIQPRTRLESVPFAIASSDGDTRTPLSQPASFPIVISTSGSYYLAGNITGVSGQPGIDVQVSDVTLDLNGYALIGVAGSLDGIVLPSGGTVENVTVFNGTVKNWGLNGVEADGANGCLFRDLRVTGNGNNGLRAGNHSHVEDCIATFNNKAGIYAGIAIGLSSIARNCVANSNSPTVNGSGTGIVSGDNSSIIGCNCRGNNGFGSSSGYGIDAGDFNTIANNTCVDNISGPSAGSGIGISADTECLIMFNTCTENAAAGGNSNGFGINTLGNCSILDNICSSNTGTGSGSGIGIVAGVGCRVERNHCALNTGSIGYGIRVSNLSAAGGAIIKNSTTGNTTAGIRMQNTGGVNYVAENLLDETVGISEVAAVNLMGTGDRTNVPF